MYSFSHECGLRDGDRARVSANGAEFELAVEIVESIRRGALTVRHGFGVPNMNVLSRFVESLDALTGMVGCSGLPIALEPA